MSYQVKIAENAETLQMIQSLASTNRADFDQAMEAVAAFISDVILQVIPQAPIVSNLFTDITYLKGTAPSLPLATYYDVRDRNYIQVWTQAIPGGFATNQVHGLNELMVATFWLNSAVSMLKEYAENGRLDVVAASIERMSQEILIQQESISANIISAAIGQARYTTVAGASVPQGIQVATADTFQMDDFNRVITLLQRIRPSWVGGTPVRGNIISHLIGSPEFHEELRSIAYQPQNTRAGSVGSTQSNTALSAPDDLRESVFNAAGNASFFGVELLNVYEMGVGGPYNQLFANYIGSTQYDGSNTFDPTTEEVIWAFNLNGNPRALSRLVERDNGGKTLQVMPDDTFPMRSEQIGWTSRVKEGRVCTDSRTLGFVTM